MNTKILTLIMALTLSLFLTLGFASAATLSTPYDLVFPATIDHTAGSFQLSFKINNTAGMDTLTLKDSSTGSASYSSISYSPTSPISVSDGSTNAQVVSVSATINFDSGQKGVLAGQIEVDPNAGSSQFIPFSVSINPSKSLSLKTTKEITYTQNGTIQVKNTGNQDLTTISLADSGSFAVDFSSDSFSLSPGATKDITVSPQKDINGKNPIDNLKFGANTIEVTASATGASTTTTTFSITQTFCKIGEKGSILDITGVDINSDGDEDDEWKALDVITIEVDVENTDNDEKVGEVFVELALFDGSGNDEIDKVDFLTSDEEKVDLGSIKKDDKETAIFEFRIPGDMDDGSYRLAVKAYSKDNSFGQNDLKLSERNQCSDRSSDLSDEYFQKIDVDRESDEGKFIAFDDIVFSPQDVSCGDTVSMDLTVFNIGDQDQDQVRVILASRELELSASTEITSRMKEGDKEDINFIFNIPEGLKDGTYFIDIQAEYEYDEDDDVYDENLDKAHKVGLSVFGCDVASGITGNTVNLGGSTNKLAIITATLASKAKAGEELIIKANVQNIGTQTATFAVDATGFNSWSNLDSITPRLITLASGSSKNVDFVFSVDKSADGSESFTITLLNTASSESQTQEVEINIEGLDNSKKGSIFEGNNLIWLIGIINAVLILIIIIVAVRISAK